GEGRGEDRGLEPLGAPGRDHVQEHGQGEAPKGGEEPPGGGLHRRVREEPLQGAGPRREDHPGQAQGQVRAGILRRRRFAKALRSIAASWSVGRHALMPPLLAVAIPASLSTTYCGNTSQSWRKAPCQLPSRGALGCCTVSSLPLRGGGARSATERCQGTCDSRKPSHNVLRYGRAMRAPTMPTAPVGAAISRPYGISHINNQKARSYHGRTKQDPCGRRAKECASPLHRHTL